MGCIRLSYDDFCRLTIEEFNAIAQAYNTHRESEYRDNWQRMRMLATITIQPYTKSRITPQTLLPFSWEKQQNGTRGGMKSLSKEEKKKRFEQLVEKLGKTL